MAKTLSSVALAAPTVDPNISDGGNFAMTIDPTFTGSGVVTNYVLTWEWDQGTATWATIGTSSSAGLYHAGTNPLTTNTENNSTLTIYGGAAGTYNIRGKGNTYYTAELEVTVTAAAYSLTCDYGSFAEAGQDVTFKRGEVLTCEYGSVALGGQACGLVAARIIACAYGSITLTGQDITLTYTEAVAGGVLTVALDTWISDQMWVR